MISLKHLRTPMQAIRRGQAKIIIRSRRNVKPSSEFFQILPDFIEIYEDSHQERPTQRQRRQLLLGHLFQGLNFHKQFRNCQLSPLSKCFSTHAHQFEEIHLQNAERREPSWELTEVSRNSPGLFAGFLSLEQEILRRLKNNEDSAKTHMQNNIKNVACAIQLRQQYKKPVPERIHPMDLDYLLSLKTKSSRNKQLSFLARKEHLKHKQAEEKLIKHNLKTLEKNSSVETRLMTVRNCFLRHGVSVSEATAHQWNLVRGLMFGQPIMFDLSYEGFMDRREVVNTIMQLGLIVKINKTLPDPFHIHFANIPQDGLIEKEFKRVYGDQVDSLMVSISNKSPQRLFGDEDLVYLSANSPNILTEYDSSKVYIIGGFVDRRVKSNISLGKAEESGIPHARLPLDEHLIWHKSTKNLTLDQMMCILSELKLSGNWHSALKHVPQRKHLGSR
ncbi:tRNA methyltransferase 10 homolog C-like [Asterias rubens]|uniref:tRNA methyltransferase 10 homolog C-like n=1 Tax=Asterias rubens TaxID=7604 RepID=UPI001455B7E6|nr:tRNA methyltransferase 10 homolog C-like [Asterias rubens]